MSRFSFPVSIRANAQPQRVFGTKAVLSEVPNQKNFRKVGAESTGSIPFDQLLHVVQTAAETGAQVVMDAVNKPRNITYKGLTDLVTDVDGTTNFAHDYPSFAVSVSVLFEGKSTAATVIVEEAGRTVSCMDGRNFLVFDRSLLVSNGILHAKLLERIGPATEKSKNKGIDFSLWYKPENYCTQP